MTREEAKEVCRQRMLNGVQFTFAQLDDYLTRACDSATQIDGTDRWRIADAMIQQFRKKGLIAFVRHGRNSIWTLTEAGRALAGERG